jgi:hypothetical protein
MGTKTIAGFPDSLPGEFVAFDETGETLLAAVDGTHSTFKIVRVRAEEEPVEVALVAMGAGQLTCVGSSVLVCAYDLGVVDWQTGQSAIVKTRKGESLGTGAIAPRGGCFAGVYDIGPGAVVGDRRYEVRLFERDGSVRWKAEATWMKFARGLGFSADGATLFSLEGEHRGAAEAIMGRWDVGSGKAETVAIASGGDFVATADGYVLLRSLTSTIDVYPPSFCADPRSAPLLSAPKGLLGNAYYSAMAMSPDRRELFVSSRTNRDTCVVHRLPVEGKPSELKLPIKPRAIAVGARVIAVAGSASGKGSQIRLAALDADAAPKAKPGAKASGDKGKKTAAATPAQAFTRLHEVLALAEAFYAKLDGDDVRDETLAPMTPAQIAKIEQAVGLSVPAGSADRGGNM